MKTSFMVLNIGLAWDHIKSIRDPFESNQNRHRRIVYGTPLISLVLIMSYISGHYLFHFKTLLKTQNSLFDLHIGGERFDVIFEPGIATLGLILVIYLVYSLKIIYTGLNRPGLNKDVRKDHVRR